MPDGATHSVITIAAGAATVAGLAYLGRPTSELLPLSIGFFVSLAVNPDLDLNRRFPKRNPARWLWWIYWYPYSRLIGHRSLYSHIPIIGTAIRVAYLFPLVAIFGYLWEWIPPIATIVAGLAISDAIHAVVDASSTSLKYSLRRYK